MAIPGPGQPWGAAARLSGPIPAMGVFPCPKGEKRIVSRIMILGHLAIAGIAKRKFSAENFLFLLAASFGPDLIDKSSALAFGAATRSMGHSLLMFALLTAAAWLFCQRFNLNQQLAGIGAILWLSHLTTDLLDLQTFFWPFLGPLPVGPQYTLMERLQNYYLLRLQPVQLSLEISLIIIAVILWAPASLRSRLRSPGPLPGVEGR